MCRTGGSRVKGHAVTELSVAEIPQHLRGSARVRCDAFGIEVWGQAMASRVPEDLLRAAEAPE